MSYKYEDVLNARKRLEEVNWGDWEEQARWSLLSALGQVESALSDLIPIPHRIAHNVALTLDEAVRSIREALAEMGEVQSYE